MQHKQMKYTLLKFML